MSDSDSSLKCSLQGHHIVFSQVSFWFYFCFPLLTQLPWSVSIFALDSYFPKNNFGGERTDMFGGKKEDKHLSYYFWLFAFSRSLSNSEVAPVTLPSFILSERERRNWSGPKTNLLNHQSPFRLWITLKASTMWPGVTNMFRAENLEIILGCVVH